MISFIGADISSEHGYYVSTNYFNIIYYNLMHDLLQSLSYELFLNNFTDGVYTLINFSAEPEDVNTPEYVEVFHYYV